MWVIILEADDRVAVSGLNRDECHGKLSDLEFTVIEGEYWRYWDGGGGQVYDVLFDGEAI